VADNITAPGTGESISFDDLGSVKVQRVKLQYGTDGTATDVESGAGIPTAVESVPADPFGANADAVVAAGATGSIQAKLRRLTTDLDAMMTDVATLAAAITSDKYQVDVMTMPATANSTDTIAAALQTDVIMDDTTALTPKFAKTNVSASTTDGNVVTAVTSKKIRVLQFRLHAAGTATNVTFNTKPGGAGTAISELFACGANGGRAEQFSPVGHFETASGEGLTVTTGTGSTVGVGVVYVEV